MSVTTYEEEPLQPYGHVVAAGMIVALGFAAAVGGWGMFARLDAAVVTYGVMHADSERKTVEHLEGGILSELMVQAGGRVEAGEVVARLDSTQTLELLTQLEAELTAARFALWRLGAENAGTLPLPQDAPAIGDPAMRQARIDAELALAQARLGAHESQIAALRRQIDQLGAEIEASEGRVRAAERQKALWEEERAQIAKLVERGAAPRQRLLELDRATSQAIGDRDEYLGLARAAREQIAAAENEIRSLGEQRRVEIVSAMVDNRKNAEGLESRIRSARDVLARHEMRAPQSGRVVEISTVTPGAVVGAGEPLMTILPENDDLVALTQLPPAAIDTVHPGGPAQVRLTAYKRSNAPLVPGTVSYVSADSLVDESGNTYFEVRVTPDPDALEALDDVAITAGMPVEVSLTIGERRAGDYLLEPLLRHFRRAFREE